MNAEQIERVFGRDRLKMATGEHVEVFREAVLPGERRRYTKRFLATDGADYGEWTAREWRILARLIGHGIRCVPDVVQFDAGAQGGMRQVQTYDAGVTVDQWATLLPVSRGGVVHRHVFEDCAHWWALAHHCLAALEEIHALQLVHLDVKADNICIPYGPATFAADGNAPLHAVFERLALIDFAFSLVSREKLATPLPIGWQKDYDYQSPRLLRALEAGRAGDLRPTQELDWRCDLYSLAAMLRRYLPDDEWVRTAGSAAGWTTHRYADARALIYRLRDCHDRDLPAARPHAELMEATAAHLRAADLARSLGQGWLLSRAPLPGEAASLSTPLTRIAAGPVLVTRPTAIVGARRAASVDDIRVTRTRISPTIAPAVLRNARAQRPAAVATPIAPPAASSRRSLARLGVAAGVATLAAMATPSFVQDSSTTSPESRIAAQAQAPEVAPTPAPAVPPSGAPPAVAAPQPDAATSANAPTTAAVPAPPAAPTPSLPAAATKMTAVAEPRTLAGNAKHVETRAATRGAARYPVERIAASADKPAKASGASPETRRGTRALASSSPVLASHSRQAATVERVSSTAAAGKPVVHAAAPAVPSRSPAPSEAIASVALPASATTTQAAAIAQPENASPSVAPSIVLPDAPASSVTPQPRARDADVVPVAPAAPTAATEAPRAASGGIASPPRAERAPRNEPWRSALRDVLKLFGPLVQRAAPVEERNGQAPRPPVRRNEPPARSAPPQTLVAEAPSADSARAAPAAPPPMQLAGASPVEIAPARPPAALRPASVSMAQDDLGDQARRLLTDVVPRVASQATADAYPILWTAGMADSGTQERAVVEATYRQWRSERAYSVDSGDEARARPLLEQARAAHRAGRDGDAIEMAMRAFGANPRDPDAAGLLAYLHLKLRPGQPETARALALHALAFSGARRSARLDDWNTLAVASALAGREVDASRAFMVALALSDDAELTCRNALRAYAAYGERLRGPVESLVRKVHAQGRDYGAPSCAWPAYRTLARAP